MAVWTHDHAAPAGQQDLTADRPLALLFLVWSVLIGAALVQDLAGWHGDDRVWLLDVDVERSFYTWFSSLLLACAAALLWDTGERTPNPRALRVQWMALSVLFLLLSADEALGFHELLNAPVSAVLDAPKFAVFPWVIPASLLCLAGLIALVPFLQQLPARVRTLMILSAVIFLSGVLGMELVGGHIFSNSGGDIFGDNAFEATTLAYRLVAIAEEGLEGLGVLVFIYAILLYRRERRIAAPLGGGA